MSLMTRWSRGKVLPMAAGLVGLAAAGCSPGSDPTAPTTTTGAQGGTGGHAGGGTGGGAAAGGSGGSGAAGGGGPTGTAYYGCGIAGDSLNNHQVSTEDVDYRFRAASSSAITSLIWYDIAVVHDCPPAGGQTYGCGDGGIIGICIETDDGSPDHLPTGTSLGCLDVADPMSDGLRTELFPDPPAVTAGTLYHIRWSNSSPDATNNFISVDAEFVWDATVPRQPTVPDSDWAVFRGTTLQPRDTPIFQLGYADGTVQGQGYMENWVSTAPTISGAHQVREQFTVSGAERTVRSVSVRLNRDAASAGSSPLTITLAEADGTLIEQGTIPAAAFPAGSSSDTGDNHHAWGGYSFATPRTLLAGQSYHLVLTAPADTVYRAQPIRRGPTYGFTPDTFFGDGYGQYSTDGGATWSGFDQPGGSSNRDDADVQFYFTEQAPAGD